MLEKDGAMWIRGDDLTSGVGRAVKTAKSNDIFYIARTELGGKKSGVRIRAGQGGVISSWKFDKSAIEGSQVVDDSEEDNFSAKGVTDDF